MSLPDLSVADIGLVGLYVLALLLPGGLVALAGGLRGWQLTASAPLVTYAVAGLLGPWTSAMGIPWSPVVLVLGTLLLAALVAALQLALRGRRSTSRPTARWSVRANVGVAVSVVCAVVVGAAAILGGMRGLSTIPQDWDAVFHANGIRWIADTGDAGLFGMSRVNWFVPGTEIFYPNAYHLLGAVVRQLTGMDMPAVLNAHTVLIPGLGALVLAALVRRFGGSPVHAAGTALAAVSISAVYDMLWRGPLLPYATGVALTPAFVMLIADLLDARGARDRVGAGVLLALATAGLICLHPAMLFGAAIFGLGYLVWRWARRPAALRTEPLLLLAAGVCGLALSFLQLTGSLYSASSFPAVDWPADMSWADSTIAVLTFSHASDTIQVWPTVFAALGLILYHRLGDLRWIGGPLAVFAVLFVLAASSDASWVNALTRPWWNDRWRLAAVAALTACVLVGHGIAQACALAVRAVEWLATRTGRTGVPWASAALGVLALLAFATVSRGLYLDRNATKMAINTGEGPAVSSEEVVAMHELGRIVPRGERVLNDRNDGSVWMYALAGVLPVAGHYDGTGLGDTDVGLLTTRFHDYARDSEVREAVRRLGVRYVMLDDGFLRSYEHRAAGLTHLVGARYLETVYANPDAVIYKIVDLDDDPA